jgi:hypothetical protein
MGISSERVGRSHSRRRKRRERGTERRERFLGLGLGMLLVVYRLNGSVCHDLFGDWITRRLVFVALERELGVFSSRIELELVREKYGTFVG